MVVAEGESSSATTLSAVPEGDSALPAGVVKGCGTEKPWLTTNFHDTMNDHHRSIFSASFYLAIHSVGSKKITLNHVIDVFPTKGPCLASNSLGHPMDESSIGPSLQAKWFLCWDPQICRVAQSLKVGGKPKNHLQKKGILWNPPNSTGKGSFS